MHIFFFEFAHELSNQFPGLYDSTATESGFDKYSLESGFNSKWSAYNTLYALAGESFLEIDKITMQPLLPCLTHLLFLKDKHQVEEANIKKINSANSYA